MAKLPNHEDFSKMIRTKSLPELQRIYSNVCHIYGPDSGVAALVDKHIRRHTNPPGRGIDKPHTPHQ